MQISIAILVANANQGISYVKRLVKNFKARVLSYPNSIFEAEPCLVATLTELNNIELLRQSSLVITPNAYNEGVLYDVIPNTPLGDMDVVRATTATRVNSAGLIESVAINIPRIDYTNGSCPSLLVEPQRTNLLTYSEQFDNAAWLKYRLDLGINTQISPSGVQNADTFTSSVGQASVPAIVYQSFVFVGNTRYSYSIFAKKIGTTDSFRLSYVDNSTGFTGGTVNYNLTTQSITIIQSPNASVTASMQSVGNGWYRLVLNFLTIATPTFNYVEMNIPSTSVTNTFAIWGAQLEVGAYATSYVPTVATSVTRNADVISKTGISSLIGQTEGTLFCDVTLNSRVSFSYFAIATNLASSTNYLGIAFLNNAIAFESVVAGALQANISHSNTSTGRFKIAAAYKANDFVLYINGTQIGVDTSGTIPTCSEIGLSVFNQAQALNYNSAQLYKTRLTNAELAQLTTL